MLRHHLIESHGVEGSRLRIVQRGAREPHVRADVRIGFGAVRMQKSAHKTQLLSKGSQRFSGLAECEIAAAFRPGKPTPFIDTVLGFRQRHAVRRVNGAETARNLIGHLGAHGVENRQRQCNASQDLSGKRGDRVELSDSCGISSSVRYFSRKTLLFTTYRTMSFIR